MVLATSALAVMGLTVALLRWRLSSASDGGDDDWSTTREAGLVALNRRGGPKQVWWLQCGCF